MSTDTTPAGADAPADDEAEVEEVVPRDPSAFRPSPHFATKVKDLGTDRSRHLDGEIINGCIQDGVRTKVNADVYHLRETFDAVTYRLVVDVADREVITGYPISVNTQAAKQSSRWTARQVRDIREFIASDPRPDRDYDGPESR